VPRYEGVREVADHRPGRRDVPVRPLTGCRFDGGWGKRAGLRGEVWASDNSDSRERFFR
jgi:hypothetical protein